MSCLEDLQPPYVSVAPPWNRTSRIPSRALTGREQQAGKDKQDRNRGDCQGDQDVGGQPKAATVVLEPHFLGVVLAVEGSRVGLLIWRVEEE